MSIIDQEGSLRRGALGDQGILVHEVSEVYIYIPEECSAAGFELKIAGSVKIADKNGKYYLSWRPSDLTEQDVASLYSSQVDAWDLVEPPVSETPVLEAPVIIDAKECFPDMDYQGGGLDLPGSIVPPLGSPGKESKVGAEKSSSSAIYLESNEVSFTRDSESEIKEDGYVAVHKNDGIDKKDVGKADVKKADAINFHLADLHSVKNAAKKRSLTFFLAGGQELPSLYFHDGGATGLLQALQRYIYLEKDPALPSFYYAKKFDKSQRWKPKLKPLHQGELEKDEPSEFKTIIPHGGVKGSKPGDMFQGAVSGVVGNFVGITRAVRQHLLPEKQLLPVRPGTENDNDEDFDEIIQTCVLIDVKESSSPPPPSDSAHSPKIPPPRPPAPPNSYTPRSKKKDVDPDASLITDFQLITDIRGKLPPRPEVKPRQPPVTCDEWERLRDDWGRITPDKERFFKARVFAGGIEDKLRKEAWKYLLSYYPFEVTDIERMEIRERKEKEYWTMNQQWQAFTPDQETRFTRWRETKRLIEKDVLRTDRDLPDFKSGSLGNPKLHQLENILRTYTMYNFDLGYVQGMSDLCAPLLIVMDSEVDAFWCFVGFMDMVEHHFEMSQEGMRNRLKQLRALLNITDPDLYQFLKEKECNNLYFCFRWLIVNFKREFSYNDIIALWEVVWTRYLSQDFSLFIGLAILERERNILLNQGFDFSDILQHINGLAKDIPLSPVLELAESLCYQLGSSPSLPDDLQTLVVQFLPHRVPLSSIPQAQDDTVVCNPDSRAVLSV